MLRHPRRLVAVLGGLIATLSYVWIAAVRAVPRVRRRKAAAREAWRLRRRERLGKR